MTTPTTYPRTSPAAPEPPRTGGLRLPLLIVSVGITLLAVGWGALTLASLLARQTEHRSATYDGVTAVVVDTTFEHVTVTGSADATAVALDRSFTWSLGRPEIANRVVDGTLFVQSHCPWSVGLGCSGSVDLVVPRDLSFRLDGSDGRMTLINLTGDVRATISDGSIEAIGLAGPLQLQASDGSIAATGLRSTRVSTSTSDGSLNLLFASAPTDVSARSSDGSVEIAVPHADGAYAVVATTEDGRRTVEIATNRRSSRQISAHASDGSIRITYSD